MINFTYKEVIKSSTADRLNIDNSIPETLINNLMRSTVGIQKVREYLRVPLRVNSWYRCSELNRAVGGATNSAHLKGFAIDFLPLGRKIEEVFKAIAESDLEFDQLILEHSGSTYWIHISFDPRNRRQVFELTK